MWQLKGTATPEREQRAVRLIGFAFFGLALYLVGQTAVTLVAGIRPDSSLLGIASLAATTVVMFSHAAATGYARVPSSSEARVNGCRRRVRCGD